MGRTGKSQGLAPPAIRKDARAKQARHIVNKVIPAILASNTRARKGVDESELISDPVPISTIAKSEPKEGDGGEAARYLKRKGQGRRKVKDRVLEDEDANEREEYEKGRKEKTRGKKRKDSLDDSFSRPSTVPSLPREAPKRKIRIMTTDTLTAAQILTSSQKINRKQPNPCILNMASPLRPGGGVLTGATSQEEYLCARTTLLPSLKETFYRLPEYGGVYTHDILVFRNYLPLGDVKGEIGPTERWYVDVISAGMLRFPELEGGEGEEKRLGKRDKEIVERKMRAVLRMASEKGVKKLVLGAWGCGAYGNPVSDIASGWHGVLNPNPTSITKSSKHIDRLEFFPTITEIIFAISNPRMAHDFARSFGGNIEIEVGPDGQRDEGDGDEEGDDVAEELRMKIREMEGQLGKVWNADLKERMGVILGGLKQQLKERERVDEGDEGDVIDGVSEGDGDGDRNSGMGEDGDINEGNGSSADVESADEISDEETDEEAEDSGQDIEFKLPLSQK